MKTDRYLLFLAALLCVFAAGCGKRVIPDPPLTQNKLVIELFKNLANNEHEMAIDKIIKLRAIETENQYLPQMEEFEVSNIYTDSIQKCLDSGDIDAALKIVDDARKRYGLYRSLIAAEEDLKTLKSIQESMDKILSSDSSEQILLEVEQIKKNTASYTPAKKLLPMLAFQQQLADNMANQENRRAKFSLLADLTTARKEKHSTANILAAQLALENMLPENKNSKIRENLLSGL